MGTVASALNLQIEPSQSADAPASTDRRSQSADFECRIDQSADSASDLQIGLPVCRLDQSADGDQHIQPHLRNPDARGYKP